MEGVDGGLLQLLQVRDDSVSARVGYLPPWWHHQMETFSASLVLCAGNSLVTGEFPSQRPVTRSFDIFFDLRLEKNSWVNNREAGDFEMPSCSLWHCNALPHGKLGHDFKCVIFKVNICTYRLLSQSYQQAWNSPWILSMLLLSGLFEGAINKLAMVQCRGIFKTISPLLTASFSSSSLRLFASSSSSSLRFRSSSINSNLLRRSLGGFTVYFFCSRFFSSFFT